MSILKGLKGIKDIYIWEDAVPITTKGVYHNESLGLISLSSDGVDWITMADKNLGATKVYNYGDAMSESNCGWYFQWGNNYGFAYTGPSSTSTSRVNASGYGPGNYYTSSTFIKQGYWDSSYNANLWGGNSGTLGDRKGPCPDGFHIMNDTESNSLYNIGLSLGILASNNGTGAARYLKMPMDGGLHYDSSKIGNGSGYYRLTRGDSGMGYYFGFGTSFYYAVTNYFSGYGYKIRPFKNIPTQPREGWTKLY